MCLQQQQQPTLHGSTAPSSLSSLVLPPVVLIWWLGLYRFPSLPQKPFHHHHTPTHVPCRRRRRRRHEPKTTTTTTIRAQDDDDDDTSPRRQRRRPEPTRAADDDNDDTSRRTNPRRDITSLGLNMLVVGRALASSAGRQCTGLLRTPAATQTKAVAAFGSYAADAAPVDAQPVVELREYTVHPQFLGDYLKVTDANADLRKSLLPLRLFGVPETGGALNVVRHFYYYAGGMAERKASRAAAMANKDWLAYVAQIRPHLSLQTSTIWIPATVAELDDRPEEGMAPESRGSKSPGTAPVYEILRVPQALRDRANKVVRENALQNSDALKKGATHGRFSVPMLRGQSEVSEWLLWLSFARVLSLLSLIRQ